MITPNELVWADMPTLPPGAKVAVIQGPLNETVPFTLRLKLPANYEIAGRLFREFGIPRLPPDDLARIAVPTTLIWGRHDRANRLRIAEEASARYGWPLHAIENCADDSPRDQPLAFLEALRLALGTETRQQATA